MRGVAGVTLATSAFFLLIMAVLINSPALFYMSTAVIATLGGSRLQARLSVRALRFDRWMPPTARVGETVRVSLMVWSERKTRRPLIAMSDALPASMAPRLLARPIPVAPDVEHPVFSQYSFVPMRRGKFRWDRVIVVGSDALGLVAARYEYRTPPAELTVYPAPIPVSINIQSSSGWGISELDTGRTRGAGIESRGTREYAEGDPLRYVHWPSTARAQKLMVKDFDSGTGMQMLFVLQNTRGTDIGEMPMTSFEAMCGHVCYLAREYLRKGARVYFPTLEEPNSGSWSESVRQDEVDELLATIQPDSPTSIANQLTEIRHRFQPGQTLVLLLTVADPGLPAMLRQLADLHRICLIYDAYCYAPARFPGRSAADPSYMEELRVAGATVVLMPHVERLP